LFDEKEEGADIIAEVDIGQERHMMGGGTAWKEGSQMQEHPLKIYEDLDPKLLSLVNDTRNLALADGALPRKTKLLIAMVLDAVHGSSDGVQALAREAIRAGATKEEIAEALRVAQYICGVGCVYTAARALKEVLK